MSGEAFEWADLLVVADDLIGQSADEARCRTAINRAYYAAYHRVRQRADSRGWLNQSPDPNLRRWRKHGVWLGLQTYAETTGQEQLADLADLGADLQQKRLIADYSKGFTGLAAGETVRDRAIEAINDARRVIALIEQM